MELDSDSDSDLEFLAGRVSPPSRRMPSRTASPGGSPRRTPNRTPNRARSTEPSRAPSKEPPSRSSSSSRSSAARSAAPANASADVSRATALSAADLQAELDKLRRDMWEKLGENVILRSQLDNNASAHARELGNLINQQTKAKEELRQELEQQRREVERERVQIQFLQAELRAKAGGGGGTARGAVSSGGPSAGLSSTNVLSAGAPPSGMPRQTSAHAAASTPASPSKRRAAAAAAAFSDGFVLKKQRILPALDASQAASQFAAPVNERLTQPAEVAPQPVDLAGLLALIAAHRAPGHRATTLELLYAHKLSSGISVGHRVSEFESFSQLMDTVLELVAQVSAVEDDCVGLLLSLLYAFATRRLPMEHSHKRAVSTTLCTKLADWLKQLNPLPTFEELLPPFSLPLSDLRLLTCILYTLDVLASLDWEFAVPHELSRRLITCSHVPQIVSKAINVLCLQPRSVTPELAKLVNPLVSAAPCIELLFSGLVDVPSLTVAQLCLETPHSVTTCSLASSVAAMADLRGMAEQLADAWTETLQSACVQLAQALQYDRDPPIPMSASVLAILTSNIDCPFPTEKRTIRESVFYFWCLEPVNLRDELNEDELAELEVCLAKLVFAADGAPETISHGRQLLQTLAVAADSDLVFEAFEPLGRDRSRLTGQGSSSSLGVAP